MNDQQVIHAVGLDDAYKVERVLASGAGGVTELVSLDGSGPFVRKRIPSGLARRGVWASLAECGSARLPHVVATYEMPDEFVIVCDFVPGENLEDLVRSNGRLAEADARRALLQLCEPVAALHAHGIVHRDISPTNVIMAADGAHLIDLGIARFRAEGATHDTTQLGTRGFASPEQCGYAQTDARSDVYSLGRIFGYLLTGVLPETPDSAEYERVLADEGIVSPAARQIVCRASALEPSVRYQSVAELAAALSGERDTEPVAAITGAAEPVTPPARRRRRAPLVVASVAAVALVTGAVLAADRVLGPVFSPDEDAPAELSAAGGLSAEGGADESEAAPPSGSNATAAPVDDAVALEIVDSGWSANDQGFVFYTVALKNPAPTQVDYPGISITGRDANGNVLFSQEQIFSAAPGGETVLFADMAGNGGVAPDEVEFAPLEVDAFNVTSIEGAAAEFSVSGVRTVADNLGGVSVVGEVTCEKDDGSDYGSDVRLSVVLRDASGAIVGGAPGFASRPAVGESTAFEVSLAGVPDGYGTIEVYASPW